MPKPLAQLLSGAGDHSFTGDSSLKIHALVTDSRAAQPGSLFVCLRGARDDGHAHLAEAAAAGAVAAVVDRDVESPLPAVRVPDSLTALSPIAAAFYDYPSKALRVVGVTGTNGKTTTTHFIEAMTVATGEPFGLVGTLGARLYGRFAQPVEHTTPFAHDLQALLARFRDEGASGAVLEVSSHALSLHRVDDVAFDVAAFTNLTQDHLDFHETFDDYRAAKAKLFALTQDGRGKGPGVGVLNLDDASSATLGAHVTRRLTYAVEDRRAQLAAVDVAGDARGTTFRVPSVRPAPFRVHLPGPYNVANAMAAIAVGVALDIDVDAIAQGLDAVREVPGRLTYLDGDGIHVYIDYAHTPDGLRKVLEAARSFGEGRVICVFGCGGDRDAGKRPLMGAAARELSDLTIVTSDNPRFEDPDRIIAGIVDGMRGPGNPFEVEPDRETAIERAIAAARVGDAVVIAGKGHEDYQLVRGERRAFSDADAARAAIRRVRA